MILVVPRDVLRPRRSDQHFAAEAAAARAAGVEVDDFTGTPGSYLREPKPPETIRRTTGR